MSASSFAQPIAPPLHAAVDRVRGAALEHQLRVFLVGAVFAAGIIGGMYLGSGLLTTIAAFGAIAFAVVSPPVGLMVLAFMGPLQTPLVVPAPGSNFFLCGAILMGVILRLPIERPRLRVRPALLLLSAFVLFAFAQQVPEMLSGYATDRAHVVGFTFFALATGFLTVLAAGFVLRDRSPYPYLAALLISTLFAGVLAILTVDDMPFERLLNLLPPREQDGRAAGPFSNPNYFGQVMAYGVVLAVSLVTLIRSRLARIALLGSCAVFAYAMMLSLSRGGALALVAGLVAIAFTRSRRVGFVAIAVAIVVLLVGYPAFVSWRLTTLIGDTASGAQLNLSDSDGGRMEAIMAGPALFALSPVFGIGFGQYRFMAPQVTEGNIALVAHNWYGTVLAEQGIVGIILWSLLLISVVLWMRRRPWAPRRVGFAMLAAACAGSLFTMPPQHYQTGFLPAMVLTAALVARWPRRDTVAAADVAARPTSPKAVGVRRPSLAEA